MTTISIHPDALREPAINGEIARAAAAAVADLPRDQALGLRLICLARAAAAVHMAQACAPERTPCAPALPPIPVGSTQAAGLLALGKEDTR
jgi:hypothetical protein